MCYMVNEWKIQLTQIYIYIYISSIVYVITWSWSWSFVINVTCDLSNVITSHFSSKCHLWLKINHKLKLEICKFLLVKWHSVHSTHIVCCITLSIVGCSSFDFSFLISSQCTCFATTFISLWHWSNLVDIH